MRHEAKPVPTAPATTSTVVFKNANGCTRSASSIHNRCVVECIRHNEATLKHNKATQPNEYTKTTHAQKKRASER